MNPKLQANYPELAQAVVALLGVCDGAVSQDGTGFNGYDASFIRGVASRDFCTPKMASAVWKSLRKYSRQLENFGITYSDIPNPSEAKVVKEDPAKIIKIIKVGNQVHLSNRYDADLVNLYRSNRFSSWDGDRRVNFIDLTSKWKNKNLYAAKLFIDKAKSICLVVENDPESQDLIASAFEVEHTKAEKAAKIKQEADNQREVVQTLKSDFTIDLSSELTAAGIKIRPFPYQMAGIAAIDAAKGRFIIGDQMGLGKTMQAICWAILRNKKTLVVCPASLKLNWQNEVTKFSNSSSRVVNGQWNSDSQFTIVNYEQLKKYKKEILKSKFDLVVLDESHYIKNSKSQRTQNALEVCKNSENVILLTGTAIKSRPIEFFTQLNLVDSASFGHFWSYARRYCDAKSNGYGWDLSGASNLDELNTKIGHVHIRRNKSDVLTELPAKIRQTIRIRDEEACKISDLGLDHENPVAGIQIARSTVSHYKAEFVIEWIRDFLDQNPNEKIVVFTNFLATVEKIRLAFSDICVRVVGEDSIKVRQENVDRFQSDSNIKIFVGTIQAAGVGLNLFASSTVLFCDLPWTPGELVQAEDRTHRIGQKNVVNVYRLIFENTIEDDMDILLENKYQILEKVLNGNFLTTGMESLNIQSELVEMIKARRQN